MSGAVTRRKVLQGATAVGLMAAFDRRASADGPALRPLEEVGYEQVKVLGTQQVAQRENAQSILMGLDQDSLLKPFREMSGKPGPGQSLGGWYEWKPDYDHHHDAAGLAPGSTFGQWTSALARFYASSRFDHAAGQTELRDRVVRLHGSLAEAVGIGYFAQTRFPGYSFDKLACGLMDAHRLLGDRSAFGTLDKVRAAAEPSLPGRALDRETQWKMGADVSWMWDETYTLPENLYLLSSMGAGASYREMAERYLLDKTYFEPLARGENVLADKHAYSYVNALCSAMQAYLVGGSAMHLRAAENGFAMLAQQSFATGGWGPDETLRKPGLDDLAKGLINSAAGSHNAFETPCGSYAHLKLTRYLLRATRDASYGDSMERVLLNTVMGALPLQAGGRSFYNADYNVVGKRVYSVHRWPCCSGTLPQVVADYGINGYFREPGALWVNLYQPSVVRWREGASTVSVEQVTSYPGDGDVSLKMEVSTPVAFTLWLRVPAWCGAGASLRVNGKGVPLGLDKGFAKVARVWRTGDRVTLDLPLALRLEPLRNNGGAGHPELVALMRGPLVLFALRESGEAGPVAAEPGDLLRAEQTGPLEWTVQAGGRTRKMVPFTEVGEREYTTYITLAKA